MNEKKNFRNNLIAFIVLLLMWAALFGRAMIKHLLAYRGEMLPTDYLSTAACICVLIVLLLLFGRGWREESLTDRFAKHPHRALAMLVALSSCIVFYYFITGTHFFVYEDIGTDLRDDYFPIISMVINKIKDHDFSFWTSNWGMGIDILNAQSTVCDFFNIPVYIIGVLTNLDAALFVLPFMHILKCYLCGLFTYQFLSQFELKTPAKLLAAYLSAFSGFIMLWGQHYFFASVCVWMMLIFWQIERYLHGKKNQFTLTISVALIGISSLYMTYMVGLAAAIYTVFRLAYMIRKANVREIFAIAGKMILCVVTGLLLTAVITLPVYYQLTYVSSRLDGSNSILDIIKAYLPVLPDAEELNGMLLRFFSNNLAGVGSYYEGSYNYFEQAQYYFSYMGGILLLMYYVERICHSKKKPFHILALLMTLYAIFMPLTAVIFNKFVSVAYRYTLVLIPMFAYAAAYVFSHMKKLHPVTVAVGWLLSLASIFFIYENAVRKYGSKYMYAILALLLLSMAAITIARFSIRMSNAAMAALALMMIFHATWESYTTIDGFVLKTVNGQVNTENQRSALTRANWMLPSGFGRDTEAALAELNLADDAALRVEMTYADFSRWNDSMTHNFDGYSYYNTSYNRYAETFVRTIWPEGSIFAGYASFLLNPDNAELASLLDIEYVICDENEMQGVLGYECISANDDYQIYENTNASGLGIMFDQIISWDAFDALDLDQKREMLTSAIVLGEGSAAEDIQLVDDWGSYYQENGVEFKKGDSDGEYTATVSADHTRYLMVSIPYDEGWTATIDGVEVSTLTADIGFTGLIIEAGEHQIELTYKTPWMNYGMIVSLIGLILLIAETIIFRKTDRRKAVKG